MVRLPRKRVRTGWRLLAAASGVAAVAAIGAAMAVEHAGLAPRTLAPYIEKRSSGHNPAIVAFGRFTSDTLLALDRGYASPAPAPALTLGAQPQPAGTDAGGVTVATPDALRAALSAAHAGDVITLAPGTYRFAGNALDASQPGRENAPIIVRAARPGSVQIEFDQVVGFRVSAPWWRFENLAIRGVCADDTYCEHAFQVIGAARHFVALNNTIADFNAHFKINGANGDFPDDGLIESNTLFNTRARNTANPVTPVDLVAASHWRVRLNVIRDFVKAEGNRVSYGAFAKGGGKGSVFERNVVLCEHTLHGYPGQRVGLSFGGGATGAAYCRDRKCITEQEGGIMHANLVAGCSDAGIYLNSAADSRVEDNTVLDTTGIDVRFPTSSARLDGNLVDGPVRDRDGALVHLGDNRTAPLWPTYLGRHPVRDLFAAPGQGDFSWRAEPPLRQGRRAGMSLCGLRPVRAYGAFDDFAGCRQAPPS